MPREIFALTDATKATLTDNVKSITLAWDKCLSYVYAILTSEKTDPFAPFRKMYSATVKAGVPTFHWDNDLADIRSQNQPRKSTRTAGEVLIEKIKTDAHTDAKIVAALEDGNITDYEAKEIEAAIDKERESLNALEGMLRERKREGLRIA